VSNVRLRIICSRHGRVMARIVKAGGHLGLETKQRGFREFVVMHDYEGPLEVYCPRSGRHLLVEGASVSGSGQLLVDCHRDAVLPS
jgi:hypothetical protein